MTTLVNYRRLLRMEQWYKNLVAFVPLLFPASVQVRSMIEIWLAAGGFCALSSLSYILNDWRDRAADRLHPTKCRRPLASGAISGKQALSVCIVLVLVMGFAAWHLGRWYLIVLFAYLLTSTLYSYGLKHVPLLDVVLIAGNFGLRTMAGVQTMTVDAWPLFAIVCLTILLFLSHKRRSDNKLLGETAAAHKPVLQFYGKRCCLTIRYLCFVALLGTLGYMWITQDFSLFTIIFFVLTLVSVGILFSRDPALAMRPHYLLKYWYIDLLITGTFLSLTLL